MAINSSIPANYSYQRREAAQPEYACVVNCSDRGIQVTAHLPQEFSMDVGASYEEAFAQGLSGLLGGFSETAGKTAKLLGLQLTTKALTAQTWQGSTEVSFSLPLVFQVDSDVQKDVVKPLRDLYLLTLPVESENGGLLSAPGPHIDLDKLTQQKVELNIGGTLSAVGDTVGAAIKNAFSSNSTTANASASKSPSFLEEARKARDTANKGLSSVSNALQNSIKNQISLTIGTKFHLESVVITSISSNFHVLPMKSGNFQRVEATVGFKTFYVLTDRDLDNFLPTDGRTFDSDTRAAAAAAAAIRTGNFN